MINPRGSLAREMEALFSNVLIRKPEEAKQEEESERNKATSEAVIYTENGINPDGDNTKEYQSKTDDNSEEDFNPGMISSPLGTENAVHIPATISPLMMIQTSR